MIPESKNSCGCNWINARRSSRGCDIRGIKGREREREKKIEVAFLFFLYLFRFFFRRGSRFFFFEIPSILLLIERITVRFLLFFFFFCSFSLSLSRSSIPRTSSSFTIATFSRLLPLITLASFLLNLCACVAAYTLLGGRFIRKRRYDRSGK